MAIVERDSLNSGGKDSKEKEKSVSLESILKMSKDVGEKHELDATEDAWSRSAPIPPGRYTLLPFMGKDDPKINFYDPESKKKPYFGIGLECRIQSDNPEYNNAVVFARVSTRVNRGKKISTAAGLVVKLGFKLPESITDIGLVQLLTAALKKEKTVDVEIDWRGSYTDGVDKNGKDIYKNICNSYEDFPESPDGGKEHVFTVTKSDKSKEEVRAQLNITHWYSKGEESIKKKGKVEGGGSGSNAPALVGDDDDTGLGAFAKSGEKDKDKGSKAKEKESTPAPPKDEDDLAALLGE